MCGLQAPIVPIQARVGGVCPFQSSYLCEIANLPPPNKLVFFARTMQTMTDMLIRG